MGMCGADSTERHADDLTAENRATIIVISADRMVGRMEPEMEAWSTTVTSECTCSYYDDDTDTFVSTSECYSDCFDMAWNDATYLIEQWAEHWDTDAMRIEGADMTWQRLRGYRELTFGNEFDDALRAFTINGDFTLELSLDSDMQLSVRRFSHDEPTGCRMVALPISEWSD